MLTTLICTVLQLFVLVLLAWVVLSWIRVPYDHPIGKVHRALDRLVMPVVLPLRRVIPPLNLGGVSLDISVIVIFIGVNILSRYIC